MLAADSLIAFDSLLLATTGQTGISARQSTARGTARASVQLAGNLDTLEASADFLVESLEWQNIRSPRVTGAFSWIGGQRPQLTASIGSDSLSAGRWAFHRIGAQARGWADSLEWNAGTGVGSNIARERCRALVAT